MTTINLQQLKEVVDKAFEEYGGDTKVFLESERDFLEVVTIYTAKDNDHSPIDLYLSSVEISSDPKLYDYGIFDKMLLDNREEGS